MSDSVQRRIAIISSSFLPAISIIIVLVAGYGSIFTGIVILSSSCQRRAEIIGLIDPRLLCSLLPADYDVGKHEREKISNPFLSSPRLLLLCGGAAMLGR